jgi:hypothetical protein
MRRNDASFQLLSKTLVFERPMPVSGLLDLYAGTDVRNRLFLFSRTEVGR